MKQFCLIFSLLFTSFIFSQNATTIKVTVPEDTDEVYIVGNQGALGNWQPEKVQLKKVSATDYEITLQLKFPAEFKFTRGTWDSEGILFNLSENPNVILQEASTEPLFYTIKSWSDKITSDTFSATYDFKTIHSKILNEDRTIKIYLPDSYDDNKKYPVVYLTDAGYSPNFEIALQYLKQVYNFNIIPPCILIGIVQKDRNQELDVDFTENGKKFKDFMFKEVVPYVNSNYATSNFNTLIGHSDGATFNHILMVQPDTPFRAYISMSESYFKKQLEEVANLNANYNGKDIFYFVASAEYDSEERFEIGATLDSLFSNNSNPKVHFKNQNYKADHNDLVGRSLLDGIKFVFKDYAHLNDYNQIDIAIKSNPNPMDYWQTYNSKIASTYGVGVEMNDYDFEFIKEIAVQTKDKTKYEQTLTAFPNFSDSLGLSYYAIKAQDFERMELYDDALFNWKKNIEEQRVVSNLFYYRRPYLLLVDTLHNPKDAISFLEYAIKKYEPGRLELNYYMAKTAIEHKIEKQKAKQSIAYCEKNFVENPVFTKADLKNIKQKL